MFTMGNGERLEDEKRPGRTRAYASTACVAVMLMMMAACVPEMAGSAKLRIPVSGITLGMHRSDIKAQFGEPENRMVKMGRGLLAELYVYQYTVSDIAGEWARYLTVEFVDGRVNGYAYSSSFPDDKTRFELDAKEAFVIGKSSKAEVEALLGAPQGQAAAPTVFFSSDESTSVLPDPRSVWIYRYIDRMNGIIRFSQFLELYFDEQGVLVHMDYSEEHN